MNLKISPFAEEDLKESIGYYNEQQERLGDDFVESIITTLEHIKKNTEQYPKEYKEMRKAVVSRFPFNIFFVFDSAVAYILGIFHSSRNPREIKRII